MAILGAMMGGDDDLSDVFAALLAEMSLVRWGWGCCSELLVNTRLILAGRSLNLWLELVLLEDIVFDEERRYGGTGENSPDL
jgi:hypothetical protein